MMSVTELEILGGWGNADDELDEVGIAERLFKDRIAEALEDISSIENLLEEVEKEYARRKKTLP